MDKHIQRLFKLGDLPQTMKRALALGIAESPSDKPVVEIGSLVGRSAVFIASLMAATNRDQLLYCVDPHTSGTSASGKLEFSPKHRQEFYKNLAGHDFGDRCALIGLPSDRASKAFYNESLAMLHIDGDHTEEGVSLDVSCWLPKLVRGGIIVFDDYNEEIAPGVVKLVDKLVEKGILIRVQQFETRYVARKPLKESE